MFAEPTINDFIARIDWHTAKALDRAARAVNDVRGQAALRGAINSSGAVINSFEAVRKEFDSGLEAVLGELKRVIETTALDRDDLRQVAVQRLTNFAAAAKAIAQTPEASGMGMGEYLSQQFAVMDQHLQFSIRQFDVGFFDAPEPEIPPVGNSITIGTMTGSTIQQGSPGAKQTVWDARSSRHDGGRGVVVCLRFGMMPKSSRKDMRARRSALELLASCPWWLHLGADARARLLGRPECE
jgi:hypothetical protein